MKVIDRKYLPVKWPIGATAILWLLLDRLRGALHPFVPVVAWTLMAVLWFCVFLVVINEERTSPGQIPPRSGA